MVRRNLEVLKCRFARGVDGCEGGEEADWLCGLFALLKVSLRTTEKTALIRTGVKFALGWR